MKKYASPNTIKSLINIVQRELATVKELKERVTTLENELHPKVIEVAPDGALSNWNYTLDDTNNTVTLNYYSGSETDVTVYGRYKVNGKTYDTKIVNGNNKSSTAYMFNGNATYASCKNIQTITFNEGINTSECTIMSYMFYKCIALTTINGLEYLDTSNVTNMSYMFYDCRLLTSLDLTSFDTSSVTNMTNMFSNCNALVSLDVSSFNTSKVTDMSYMFKGCSSLQKIKATTGKWVIQSGCNTTDMFTNCGVSAVTY